METIDNEAVDAHYTSGDLAARINSALSASGIDTAAITARDLKGVDEFHTGGVEATRALLEQLPVNSETRVLDIGCGIGGAARHIADASGAHVTGIDLTAEYIAVASSLSAMTGLDDKTRFQQGSAVDLPFNDGEFDLVTMFHVGMNIADKSALFSEVARVLRAGGRFALFDVMLSGDGTFEFPCPWASSAEHSAVESVAVYRDAASAAGLQAVAERQRSIFAIDFFERMFDAAKKNGKPAALGLHLLMGENTRLKIQNYYKAIKAGQLAPMEMIFGKPD